MADVRSLLQSERSSRKVKHPHAAYTSTGQLMCSVCRCPIKSATLWENHLRSEGHLTVIKKSRASRSAHVDQDAVPAPSKKRKAEADDDQENKRVRNGAGDGKDGHDNSDTVRLGHLGSPEVRPEAGSDVVERSTVAEAEASDDRTSLGSVKAVNEDEWTAFERDMAAMDGPEPANTPAASILQAAPTISAAPMSAEQLAAQAREEQSVQKGAREAELEDERDDASRQMDEELVRMDQLDEKMREWRARKEALRGLVKQESGAKAQATSEPPLAGKLRSANDDEGRALESEDDDDDDDDEDPAWRGLGGV